MSKKDKSIFHFLGVKKQKGDNAKNKVIPVVRHGGVVKISLDWHFDEMGEKTVVFKKYEHRVQARQTVGVFIAGGVSVDRAVREANVRCMSNHGVDVQ